MEVLVWIWDILEDIVLEVLVSGLVFYFVCDFLVVGDVDGDVFV